MEVCAARPGRKVRRARPEKPAHKVRRVRKVRKARRDLPERVRLRQHRKADIPEVKQLSMRHLQI